MKKSDIVLIGVVLLIVVVALFSSEKVEEVNYPLTLAGEVGLQQITYDQYEEKVENGDAFIVVIERDGCSFCTMYMPIIEEVANEKKIPLYYIDIADLTNEELTELTTTNKYLKRNPQWGTPTTLFMLGDRVLDSIGQYVDKDSVLEFLDGRVVMSE